ncbi:hypothetical protein M2164_006520 [Streptomyces sp. SAI-208]|uniref:DUF3618 domain-containing protein n=1 Tax=unclassified Streptomyces TaxID=2593676 RepID=UPI002475ABFF|nr:MULTISPECIES: DUF3618 domain-containing protein [unclassified Streptomyces]MDH6519909.1 hypothetical protein [Streptomyces sp. SAI-090]MDH6571210.1 hypothetical protein [Streptomyces sp. SAI-117]MDH6583824.1 hypothetical protein [Streptomyces sp. SAI-133]MDH6610885.1 hypothetical protein [Streptomyces sp. SAI-208]MDH6615997.1 hypothetical protein [Streptomyces sp. SAI-135]
MTDRTGSEPPVTGAKGPEELRQQIERTRSELGDTVEELAGKMDVKGRARARAADLRDKAGAMTVQLRSSAAQAGHTVHDKATQAGHLVQDRAVQASHKVQDRTQRAGRLTQGKAAETSAALERRAEHGVPQPARPLVMAALRHPRPVLIVGAALAAIVVVSWRYPKK